MISQIEEWHEQAADSQPRKRQLAAANLKRRDGDSGRLERLVRRLHHQPQVFQAEAQVL